MVHKSYNICNDTFTFQISTKYRNWGSTPNYFCVEIFTYTYQIKKVFCIIDIKKYPTFDETCKNLSNVEISIQTCDFPCSGEYHISVSKYTALFIFLKKETFVPDIFTDSILVC